MSEHDDEELEEPLESEDEEGLDDEERAFRSGQADLDEEQDDADDL
jgi:hypothetical protein